MDQPWAMLVDVIGPVVVAALVNDAVGVIDAVNDDATGGWERLKARADRTLARHP